MKGYAKNVRGFHPLGLPSPGGQPLPHGIFPCSWDCASAGESLPFWRAVPLSTKV